MKVALKYCGGCDPAFERVEYFERIRAAAGEAIEWVRPEDPALRAVLLICGCPRACAAGELSFHRPLVCLARDDLTPEGVVSLLVERGKT
ncbi:MAG: hypothetical protein KJ621_18325 [Proteobacteria bacterium]|nr:hypothetical protein [Pseudomonadota bacterium]MBU1740162.1 hypothetical protein [Pseudomonadota bacterium]